jgi:hypothetical protein
LNRILTSPKENEGGDSKCHGPTRFRSAFIGYSISGRPTVPRHAASKHRDLQSRCIATILDKKSIKKAENHFWHTFCSCQLFVSIRNQHESLFYFTMYQYNMNQVEFKSKFIFTNLRLWPVSFGVGSRSDTGLFFWTYYGR